MASWLPLFFPGLIFPQCLSLCVFSLFLSPFSSISLFFLTDALLTEVVLRLGCAARLTLLLRRSRCDQTQCVCVCEGV